MEQRFPPIWTTFQRVHYAQLYLSGNFESYDCSELGNWQHYGQATPLESDSTNCYFKADADDLADFIDIDLLFNEHPNVVFDHIVDIEGWTHADCVAVMDADVLVYDYVLDLIINYWF